MAGDYLLRLGRSTSSENLLGRLGFTSLRWDTKRGAYVGHGTTAALSALGQQSRCIPQDAWEYLGRDDGMRGTASKETLRKLARAAAVADGNAFVGSALDRADRMESQYEPEARSAVMVLEGLGIDPDIFAKLYPDPMAAFVRLAPVPVARPPEDPDPATDALDVPEPAPAEAVSDTPLPANDEAPLLLEAFRL